MILRQPIQRAFAAIWEVPLEDADRVLHRGVEPLPVDGSALVSLLLVRFGVGGAGPVPIPGYGQLELLVHARAGDAEGPYAVLTRVSPLGFTCLLRSVPYRATVVRLDESRAEVPGAGVRFRFEPGAAGGAMPEVEPGFGREPFVLVPARSTKGYARVVASLEWRPAALTEPPTIDPLHALGFDVGPPRWVLVGGPAAVEATVPPKVLARPPG